MSKNTIFGLISMGITGCMLITQLFIHLEMYITNRLQPPLLIISYIGIIAFASMLWFAIKED